MGDSVPERGPVLNMLNDTSTGAALSAVLSFFESRRSTVRDGAIVEGPVATLQIVGKEEAARKAMIVASDVVGCGAAVIREIVCEEAEVDGTPKLHPLVPRGGPEAIMEFYMWQIVRMKGYEGVRIGITMTEHPRFRRMLGEPEPELPQEETPEEYNI